MITKPLIRNAFKIASYIFVFLWAAFSAFAQCPTIADSNPPPICNASGFKVSNLNAYATNTGGGIVWYTTSTGGSPLSAGLLVTQQRYYADSNAGSCGTRPFVDIDFQINPTGQNLDKVYCSNENATIQTYIDDILMAYIPSGGSVIVYNNITLTSQANTTDVIPNGHKNYYIVFYDGPSGTGCASQIELAKTAVFNSPADPTPAGSQIFCADSNPTVADLNTGTTSTNFNWYDTIDIDGDPVQPALLLSTPLVDGSTYYIQVNNGCVSNPIPVTVTIDTPVQPGTPSTLDYCNDSLPASDFNLFDELGGPKEITGSWSGSLTTTNGHLGTVNISTLTTEGNYVFTYTVPSTGACPDGVTTVTIRVYKTYSSGTPSVANPTTFCVVNLPSAFDLSTLLDNEDPNGQWTQGTLSSDPVVSNPINLTGFTPATYNFTYTQNVSPNPCLEQSTTVQVIVLANPNAGNAINPSPQFCENDLVASSPFNLFDALDGSQDNNSGTWRDASNTTISNSLDLTSLNVAGSPYSYNYTIDNGSCLDTEIITIIVEEAPESGTANPPIEFCQGLAPSNYNLFDLLTGEDQTGTWYLGLDNTGAVVLNPVDLSALTSGNYNFTYDVSAIGSCDDVLVTVTIIINDTPAPTASATQEFCDTATVSNLVATGTTIKWYDVATGGTALLGTTSLTNGATYYATQTNATTGCESSVRTPVIATIYQSPKSGVAIPITDCNTNNAIDLFTALDGTQDAGGTWQDTDSTGALTGNVFDATGLAAGNYQFTYLVTASAPCVDSSTIVTITIDEPLNAGANNTLDVCSNNGTTDLFTLIGSADTGGTWSPAMASGTGVFNPLVDAPATYIYTLTNACGTVSSDVVVTVTLAPNAGTNNTAAICVIDGQTDLFPFLGTAAQSGGTWSPTLTSGTGEFDPLVDTAQVYTYTVTAVSPCSPNSSAQITVTISDSPAPVVVDATPSFCLVNNPTVANLESSITATGTVTWYSDAALTTSLNTSDVLIDGQDYYATNNTGCESSSNVQITVTINDTPTPTLKDSGKEYCINDNPTINDLTDNITESNSNNDNVVWYNAGVNGSVISSSTSLTNLTTYYVALVDAITGCESSIRLAVTPDLTSCGVLRLPDGFSPNGDGVNDTFEVDNLAILYPNFEIEIYNRYGSVVYKGNASTPRFDGKSNQARTTFKGDLPVGMYYYIFNFNDGENKPKQGHLYLSR